MKKENPFYCKGFIYWITFNFGTHLVNTYSYTHSCPIELKGADLLFRTKCFVVRVLQPSYK